MTNPTIPTSMGASGLQPISPAALRAQLIALAEAMAPGLTTDLPGSLIEDISSTDVGALTVVDQARVDLIASLTPFSANPYLLLQLGALLGIEPGADTNTSVYCLFSGTPGFIIPPGFTVSDGSYQYAVQDGGIIGANGFSLQLYCLATQPGTWPVPANTVKTLITSVPGGITLVVNNPSAGIPSPGAQTLSSYQAQVIQANQAKAQGMPQQVKTLLQAVPGVQERLISVRQLSGQWEVIVGGGDPYQVAYALYSGLLDISNLTGSVLAVLGITNANPGVVTCNQNHGYANGQVIILAGVVGMFGINGQAFTITVIDQKNFSLGIDTTGLGVYQTGGTISPNFRNQPVSINNYPDTYVVPLVLPPQQIVGINLVWNTNSPNFVSPSSIAQLGQPALIDYINSIPVGQSINVFELQNAFQLAIVSVLPTYLLSRMIFTVTINGVLTQPDLGTGLIEGDPESYFETDVAHVIINQG